MILAFGESLQSKLTVKLVSIFIVGKEKNVMGIEGTIKGSNQIKIVIQLLKGYADSHKPLS